MINDSTSDTYTDDIKRTEYVVVDFWASWCHPCKMMNVTLQNVHNKLTGYNNISFYKVNAETSPEISVIYNINSMPTLLFFKNGVLSKRCIGLHSEQQILDVLNELKGK